MKKRYVALVSGIFITCIVLLGCKCNNSKPIQNSVDSTSDTSDVIETPDSFSMDGIKQKDSASIFQNDTITRALNKLSIQKESWNNAILTDIDTIKQKEGMPTVKVDESFLKKYASVIKPSPDGLHILDFGSDNSIVDPKTGKLYESDPEMDISLIDKSNGEKRLLLQLGGSGHIVHIDWLGSEKVAILCTLPGKNPKKDDTFLYVYSVQEHIMKTYQWL